ncbi:MAG: hypothetical protein EU533_01335 [Promethearchaeota archaeon]|nr:MAG: hypothetical protein EU533_01335 [Candidatus Lokiarchaeota archaeon]
MPKEVKGLLITRLIVLVLIICIPISIFFIYNIIPFSLWYSNDPTLNFWVIKILIPSVFSVSWLFFLILFANRLAESMELFDEKIGVVPSRLKFFYGINAVYLLVIFVFPLVTPVISILSFASFAWRLTTFKKESWEEDTEISFFIKFLMVLFAILPLFCTVSIIHQYLDLSFFLWNDIWVRVLPYLFIFSYSLFTALAFGSLIILFSNAGISEYEQIWSETPTKNRFWKVKVFEGILFAFFLYLDLSRYFGIYEYDLIDFFYLAGFIIIIFTSIVNYVRGKSKYKGFKGHLIGYFIATVFIGSNVIFTSELISELLRVWSLLLSAIMYIFVLFYTFITIEE